MKLSTQLSLVLILAALNSGCSGKPFTLQSYADEYFNDKNSTKEMEGKGSTEPIETTQTVEEETKTDTSSNNIAVPSSNIDDETTNAAIKSGPGSDIAWSSTYKKDKEKGGGALQKSLDEWTQKEWEPAFEGDVNQSNKDQEANEHFTLQHYVDKAGKYMDKKDAEEAGKPQEPAHYEKMESLPVIGN